MQLWNDFLDWLGSDEGMRLISSVILPVVGIIVAGAVVALVARTAINRVLSRHDRALRASAVEALIAVGEKASQWSGLSGQTRDHFEAQSSVASIRVRLLPAAGSAMASAWAEYQLADIKRNSANFSVQADQGFIEYRDRLIDWHHRPARAKKLFLPDLERFRLDSAVVDTDLIERQRRWKAEQSEKPSAPVVATARTGPADTAAAPAGAAHTATAPAGAARAPEVPTAQSPDSGSYAPIVPPATARAFAPTQNPPVTASNEVIEATIDDDSQAQTGSTRVL